MESSVKNDGISDNTVRLAAVQAAPIWLDRDATVRKAAKIVREAAARGATIVGFPEGFIPGHPAWYHFHTTASAKSRALVVRLFRQAVDLDGHDLDELRDAAKEAKCYVVVGMTERRTGTTGTLFNTQALIDPTGSVAGVHQKLVPTVSERLVHAPGSHETQRAFNTAIGPISGLICGENANPFAIARVVTEYPIVHVASWPSNFARGLGSMRECGLMVSRSVAYSCACYVILSASVNSDVMVSDLATSEVEAEFMRSSEFTGGSCIIDPYGHVVAGPLEGGREGIVYADADLDACIRMRSTHDFAGHYNRADVYQLHVNTETPELISFGPQSRPYVKRAPLNLTEQVPREPDTSESTGGRAAPRPTKGIRVATRASSS